MSVEDGGKGCGTCLRVCSFLEAEEEAEKDRNGAGRHGVQRMLAQRVFLNTLGASGSEVASARRDGMHGEDEAKRVEVDPGGERDRSEEWAGGTWTRRPCHPLCASSTLVTTVHTVSALPSLFPSDFHSPPLFSPPRANKYTAPTCCDGPSHL